MRIGRIRALICLPLMPCAAAGAEYEYRYIEGEDFARGEAHGLREEGFTTWMGHPSGGRVAVFGRPAGGLLEYDVEGLGPGPYRLFVRCLAHTTTRTRVSWNGEPLGMISHRSPGTALLWSAPLAVPEGAGDHILRLEGSEDTTQWPYIDVILLTTQAGYRPDDADADFVSFTTPFPALHVPVRDGGEAVSVAPAPPAAPSSAEGLRILEAAVGEPGIGEMELRLALEATRTGAVAVAVALTAASGVTRQVEKRVEARAGEVTQVRLTAPVREAGESRLVVTVRAGEGAATGEYALRIPPPVAVTLDEYAYPVGTAAAAWTARLDCSPAVAARLRADISLTREGEEAALRTWAAGDGGQTARLAVALELADLPVGRYRLDSAFTVDGEAVQHDAREMMVFRPVEWPAWEPVSETRAEGGLVLLNGRPFVGRLLFHAGATERVRGQGYNLVQCWGGDPDPLPSIRRHLDACGEAGMYGAVALFNNRFFFEDAAFKLENIERAVLAFKDHPALWGWDLIDEPDIHAGLSPEAVLEAADLIRRLDNRRLVWVNLCQTTKALDYLESQDLWSFDVYPFPSAGLFHYRRWLDISDEHLLGRKPLGTCLQTYSYSQRPDDRMPTPDELRASAYLHIMHGYTWFGYYSYYDPEPAGCLARAPELWSYTRALNTELQRLEEVIVAPGEWRDVPVEPPNPALQAREKRVGEMVYVLVVSDAREPVSAVLRPSPQRFAWRLLFEEEAEPVVGTSIPATLRPTGSRVYELVAQGGAGP